MVEPTSVLDRYRDLVDDFVAFEEASRAPLPRVVWAHPERITPGALRERLEAAGLRVTPLALPGALRVDGTTHPGRLLEYRLGLCHTQEAVSLVPPELLGARPGERVLDACAAPGGKTARIALAMRGRGTVVANDRHPGRLRALSNLVERLGLVNVVATRANAAALPRAFGTFDRVLCDVPCSGEGTSRKHPRVLVEPFADRASLARLQREILARAVARLAPGGRLVYSTCTYAPEENEAVVDHVLAEAEGTLRVVETGIEGLEASPGVTEWDGRRFAEELRHALRFWPHVGDGGGFFAVLLEKSVDAPPPEENVAREATDPHEAEVRALVERFAERHGVPNAAFEGLAFRRFSKKRVSMESADLRPPPSQWVVHRGIPFCHRGSVDVLPTTSAARRFAPLATRHVVALERAQLEPFVAREDVALGAAAERGFALVVCDGFPVGTGVVREGPGGRTLESFFPRASPVDDAADDPPTGTA